MCGIAGKLYFKTREVNSQAEKSAIRSVLSKLHHRGPDDAGSFLSAKIWLVSTRLAILDLSAAGHQPMISPDGKVVLVFNGEIYNYRNLREKLKNKYSFKSRGDSEVLLAMYLHYGIKCLAFLRGMFAFVVWDGRLNKLFLARDRLGKKPLKYYFDDNFFAFASELKALISQPGIPSIFDETVLQEYFTNGYVKSPQTGYKNIFKLPPAHYLVVSSSGKQSLHKYWDIDYSHKLNLSENEWIEILSDKLVECVKIRLESDVPLGFHLSGGMDSSLVCAIAASVSGKKINTFSVGFAENEYNELPYARNIAAAIGSSHHELTVRENSLKFLGDIVKSYEEPFADPSMLPTWMLMKKTGKMVRVAINGDGGDENFAGYPRYLFWKYHRQLNSLPWQKEAVSLLKIFYRILKIRSLSVVSGKYLPALGKDRVNAYLSASALTGEKEVGLLLKKNRKHFQKMQLNSLDDVLAYDRKSYLADYLLPKVDIASMAHSLEVRSPLLDHTLFELSAQLPDRLKINGLQRKYIMRKIIARKFPGLPIRQKHGFLPPLASWFRGKYEKQVRDEFFDGVLSGSDLFDMSYINKVLKEHAEGINDHAYLIWSLLCFKKWLGQLNIL
ncbi:MAG: asparagine synthase, asparagine synthase (glutamine-hydrolysing) [Candidatus Gottesmanbacteria bacterium GW2011_GWA2_43_14]|uniref:asparagine synthase (glutamine-hydrolyzing) n=1 Tax=Candidatus Gottesmanbacteria bacterium GW2011_GWA2_43_14 TaxID=1618443 RepID=A0A0G1GHZ8_9BACT|nr:MAG: asparagine synthase, asparagine synthase (glutamine-hydrolysing) [Candidatus Gottesmanbacteria bacterium GW2011_GWA2_43_14]